MAITAQDVNKLRKETGAGMMDCKKALQEADGDFEAAIDLLRKKGQKISAKRADRSASEGSVFVQTSSDNATGFLIALNCETDFVAKNEDFVNLGAAMIGIAAQNNLGTIADLQAASMEDGRKVEEHLTDLMGKIGEKLEISSLEVVSGDAVIPYVHSNKKLGVLVALTGESSDAAVEVGKDVAMQIAAMNPVAVDKDGVDADLVERERAIGREQALAEGKPENIIDKIAEGKVNKFYKENTLLNQQFVKDSSKTVSQVLKDVSSELTVATFKRVTIG